MRRLPCTRRALALHALLVAAALPAAPAAAQSQDAKLKTVLTREMKAGAAASGAYVVDADTGTVLFGWKSTTSRILASNTKLFTIGATLAAQGPGGTLETEAFASGTLDSVTGTLAGDLYLHGAGDPSFGSDAYNGPRYGGGASADALAARLADRGLKRVTGRIVGDESLWDSLRGTAYSGFAGSGDIGGPLTALAYNHARTSAGSFQVNPPVYAATQFQDALQKAGVKVSGQPAAGQAPDSAVSLASVRSSPFSKLVQITGVRSENWFAEMLAKGLTIDGTTRAGAAQARRFARSMGSSASVVDGSGLSRSDRAPPREVVDFLVGERARPDAAVLEGALPTAGVSGTLAGRMRSGPAHNRCHAKTGTLSGVTALSGYCHTLGGATLAFSILMNNANVTSGRARQDRMAQAIAAYRG
jgi:D-alanyl-D-alanine carboxypeptidase/D-alanyl-D-alanine-endopeptidase (penicillin-binding protein 4)